MEAVLTNEPSFFPLQKIFLEGSTQGLSTYIMNLSDAHVDEMLVPLVKKAIVKNTSNKHTPEYWVKKLVGQMKDFHHLDRGIFFLYFLNIMRVEKGEAVYQPAGLPHAYLEGQNVELMANSDNVLRGGLTSKHIDVQELLRHTNFTGIDPKVVPYTMHDKEQLFDCPVEDFGIAALRLESMESIALQTYSCEILIVLNGAATFIANEKEIYCHKGMSVIVLPNTHYNIIANAPDTEIYKAFVPK